VIARVLTCGALLGALYTPLAAQRPTERVIPLSLALAETVYGMGAGGMVVAVPAGVEAIRATRGLPVIGHGRTPSAEAVIAARPTLVIGDSSIDATLALQLRRAGLRLLLTTAEETMAGAEARATMVGHWLQRDAAASALIDTMRSQFATAAALRPTTPPRTVFIYARGLGTVYAAGRGTGVTELIQLAGGTNPITAFDGYKPLTAEALIVARPEVIVLTSHGLASVGGIDGLLRIPGIATTPAGRARRIVTVDDHLILGFGPMAGEAAMQLATAFRDAGGASASAPRAR
jgi:iron complex transport system substrate-binding protein